MQLLMWMDFFLRERLQTVICGSPGRTRVGKNRSLQRRAETRPAFDAAPLVVNRSGAGSTRDLPTEETEYVLSYFPGCMLIPQRTFVWGRERWPRRIGIVSERSCGLGHLN